MNIQYKVERKTPICVFAEVNERVYVQERSEQVKKLVRLLRTKNIMRKIYI